MSEQCIFCKIVNKEIPAEIVYEDDSVVAFLDIRPVSKGHTLVVPKKHSNDFLSTEDDVLEALIPEIKKIGAAVMKAVGAHGMNISTNHGAAAGQVVFHLHFHLIPRFSNDNLMPWPHGDSEPKNRQELAEEIKKLLA
ncbi:MAG: HIT family protein [Candidatus Doudnabacteria bacterium]|nr:HIT family protein [Candidatus Doudnabacteria bacterium]